MTRYRNMLFWSSTSQPYAIIHVYTNVKKLKNTAIDITNRPMPLGHSRTQHGTDNSAVASTGRKTSACCQRQRTQYVQRREFRQAESKGQAPQAASQSSGDIDIETVFDSRAKQAVRSHYGSSFAGKPCPLGLIKKYNHGDLVPESATP